MANNSNRLSGLPWIRIGAESVAIVGSILLAFAIDAWWDSSLDRKEEQNILEGLEDEFSAHVDDLESNLLGNERRLHSMTVFMSYTSGEEGIFSIPSLDSAISAIMYGGTWDPTTSVLDAVVTSGRLELIQNDSLRNRLAQWGAVIDEVRDNEVTMRQYLLNSVWPLLATSGAPKARGWNVGNDPMYRDKWDRMNAQMDPLLEYESLRGNREMYHLASTKVRWMIASKSELEGALQVAREIQALIRYQLE